MSETPPAKFRRIIRADFNAFNTRAFTLLNPQTRFAPNWHLEVLAAKLEAVRQGKIRRLIVNVPPRSLKSHTASVAFPAWLLGHDPAAQILCVSYAQDLTDKFARDCRKLMATRLFKELFPACRLSAAKQAVSEFETGAGGFRLSVSVGGPLTGRGADIVIIDDPLKPADALSEAGRPAVNEWYDNTLYSRLNDKTTGAIVIIMQRLHQDDLVGHVLEQEPWEVVSFPAIAERDDEFIIDIPYGGPHTFRRKAGNVLQPDREPKDVLDGIRKAIGEYNFQAQYQQNPTPPEGIVVKEAWFPRYDLDTPPEPFDSIVQSWDTAAKTKEVHDYSVCTTWGVKGAHFYLLNVLRRRMEFPELKRTVKAMAALWGAANVLIEDAPPSGTSLIQDLHAENMHAVTPCSLRGSEKLMRLQAQTPTMEGGFVHLPKDAPWLAEYLLELTAFPGAKHDDQVDSTTQALAWLKGAGREPSPLTAIKQQLKEHQERLHGGREQMVRILMPEGTEATQFQLLSGRKVMPDSTRIVEVSENDAKSLIRQGGKQVG
jgi:predicted phage terminase large subunit-like protein